MIMSVTHSKYSNFIYMIRSSLYMALRQQKKFMREKRQTRASGQQRTRNTKTSMYVGKGKLNCERTKLNCSILCMRERMRDILREFCVSTCGRERNAAKRMKFSRVKKTKFLRMNFVSGSLSILFDSCAPSLLVLGFLFAYDDSTNVIGGRIWKHVNTYMKRKNVLLKQPQNTQN